MCKSRKRCVGVFFQYRGIRRRQGRILLLLLLLLLRIPSPRMRRMIPRRRMRRRRMNSKIVVIKKDHSSPVESKYVLSITKDGKDSILPVEDGDYLDFTLYPITPLKLSSPRENTTPWLSIKPPNVLLYPYPTDADPYQWKCYPCWNDLILFIYGWIMINRVVRGQNNLRKRLEWQGVN